MAFKTSRTFMVLVTIQAAAVSLVTDIAKIPEPSDLNFTQIISKYSYESEEHTVNTEDGYILKIFRLIRTSCTGKIKGRPVILMHGYLLSADAWVVSGPKAGLGYLIADLCLDLWIGNFRGNFYSRNHVTLNPDEDLDFWKYSHTELGRYDLPAMIDYVLNATGSSDVNYVGFSQGAGCFYVMCSERPRYSEKVSLMISLAPSTRHLKTESVFFRLQAGTARIFQRNFENVHDVELLAKGSAISQVLLIICSISRTLCDILKDQFDAKIYHPGFTSNETLLNIWKTFPAGTSVQNSAHFGQLIVSPEFKKFDYGVAENLKVYGSAEAPSYNLSAVATPVVVIYSLNDAIVDFKDVLWSSERLPNVLEVYRVKAPYTHTDVTYSRFTKDLLFPKIREYLLRYSQA